MSSMYIDKIIKVVKVKQNMILEKSLRSCRNTEKQIKSMFPVDVQVLL